MVSLSTHNIKVSAETFYEEKLSKPDINEFLFTYRIIIENNSSNTVQLLKRSWVVTNSYGKTQVIEGEGVIGKKPVIEPGDHHQYISGMHLKTEIGKMHGTYFMNQMIDNIILEIQIPEFKLIAPFKMN